MQKTRFVNSNKQRFASYLVNKTITEQGFKSPYWVNVAHKKMMFMLTVISVKCELSSGLAFVSDGPRSAVLWKAPLQMYSAGLASSTGNP